MSWCHNLKPSGFRARFRVRGLGACDHLRLVISSIMKIIKIGNVNNHDLHMNLAHATRIQ
jgi:hypothetical protein